MFVKHKLSKGFIMPLKANRKVTLSEVTKCNGQRIRLDALTLEANTPMESVEFPLLLLKQVFTNEDSRTAIQRELWINEVLQTGELRKIEGGFLRLVGIGD